MTTYFTGKDLKEASKKVDSVVIRLDVGGSQCLDFSYLGSSMTSRIECKPSFKTYFQPRDTMSDYVYMFASQYDTTWQFLLASLRATDRVVFVERNNGTENLKEAGLVACELRARIERVNKEGKAVKHFECAIKSEIKKISQANIDKNTRMTREQLMDWAADYYDVIPDCEGDPDQALMSGWVNAMYTHEETTGGINDAEFVRVAYDCFDNMGYNK